MDSPLIKTLKKYVTITAEEIEIINERVTPRHFKKGDLFLKEGKPSRSIGFILSGVFRLFNIDEDGKEVTSLFFKEGSFLVDLDSFHHDIPSVGGLQAETDADLLVISRDSYNQLHGLIKEWGFTTKRISQKALIDGMKFQRKLIDQEAIESYQDFLEHYPTIAKRVPDHHLASFMGITKHTLSRIRKKIVS